MMEKSDSNKLNIRDLKRGLFVALATSSLTGLIISAPIVFKPLMATLSSGEFPDKTMLIAISAKLIGVLFTAAGSGISSAVGYLAMNLKTNKDGKIVK